MGQNTPPLHLYPEAAAAREAIAGLLESLFIVVDSCEKVVGRNKERSADAWRRTEDGRAKVGLGRKTAYCFVPVRRRHHCRHLLLVVRHCPSGRRIHQPGCMIGLRRGARCCCCMPEDSGGGRRCALLLSRQMMMRRTIVVAVDQPVREGMIQSWLMSTTSPPDQVSARRVEEGGCTTHITFEIFAE